MTTPAPSGDVPRIFVSHAHTDNGFCRDYVAGLRAHGCYVWYDEHNLGWGALRPTIEREMPTCPHFVAILTPASVASEWVNTEIDAALDLLKDGTLHTLTFVVAAPCTVPLLLRRWKRIEGPDGAAVSVAEAVARTLTIVGAPSVAPAIPHVPATPRPDPAPPVFSPTHTTPRLSQLGFGARVINHQGNSVEVILPPLCPVPAGPFRMGSDPRQDSSAENDEKPPHEVNLAAFQIARFPVTVAEYACYQRATGKTAPTDKLDHPVVNVSWRDATAYAAWLAQLTGQPWRLPTEAEWETSARYDPATRASRIYPWGDTFDKSRCNTREGGPGGTTPVGSYPSGASPCGAQDMAGNVWEWTSSVFKPYPYSATDGRERADSTDNRVLRGGSGSGNPAGARAACRGHGVPAGAYVAGGFRVVVAGAAPGS